MPSRPLEQRCWRIIRQLSPIPQRDALLPRRRQRVYAPIVNSSMSRDANPSPAHWNRTWQPTNGVHLAPKNMSNFTWNPSCGIVFQTAHATITGGQEQPQSAKQSSGDSSDEAIYRSATTISARPALQRGGPNPGTKSWPRDLSGNHRAPTEYTKSSGRRFSTLPESEHCSAGTESCKSPLLKSADGCRSSNEEAHDTESSPSRSDVQKTITIRQSRAELYGIPEQVLQRAIKAHQAGEASGSHWEYDMFVGPENKKVILHYCTTREHSKRVAQHFLGETVVGFDLEWKPVIWRGMKPKDGVSLIQLACENRIALFHLALHRETEPEDVIAPTLKRILESPEITKAGVAVKGDATRLRKHYGVEVRGLFELSHLQKLLKYLQGDIPKVNKILASLTGMVEEHFGLPLSKDDDVRSSDWSKALRPEQIKYAASDAYAGYQLYHILDQKRMALDPPPPLPRHAELNLPIRLSESDDELLPSTTNADLENDAWSTESDDGEFVDTAPPSDNPMTSARKTAGTTGARRTQAKSDARDTRSGTRSTTTVQKASTSNPTPSGVVAADMWVADFRASLASANSPKSNQATHSMLRAYALWHHQAVCVPEIASLLRSPPLTNGTVSTYVLESIRIHKLPYDGQRIPDVLVHVHKTLWTSRYRLLAKGLQQ